MSDPTRLTTGNDTDPRARLRALHHELQQHGAHIPLVDIDALPADVINDLAQDAAKRLRAIHEGLRNGWTPPDDWGTGA